MIRPLVLLVLFFIAGLQSIIAQHKVMGVADIYDIRDKVAGQNAQYSGLCAVGNDIYIIAERSRYLVKYNLTKKDTVDSVLVTSDTSADLEAVCYYNGKVYITDEENVKIYAFDLSTKNVDTLEIKNGDYKLYRKDRNSGIEGLCVSPDGKDWYLLVERNDKDDPTAAYIYQLSLQGNSFTIIKADTLPLRDKERYSDLYFDTTDNNLKLLRTSNTNYYIYQMDFNIVKNTPMIYADLTKAIDDLGNRRYSQNIEGLTRIGTDFYVISDNGNGNTPLKTAFVKLADTNLSVTTTTNSSNIHTVNKPFTSLPASINLKDYCPRGKYQYRATCFAYATVYTALSIEHNIRNNTKYGSGHTEFSPGFIASYLNSKLKLHQRSVYCGMYGTASRALHALNTVGTVSYTAKECGCKPYKQIKATDKANALAYKISGFDSLDLSELSADSSLRWIRSALDNNHPVIITVFQTELMLNYDKPEFYAPLPDAVERQILPDVNANHVICIVGYEDDKEIKGKGKFIIKNNFKEWGDKEGFAMVQYTYLLPFIKDAYFINL